MDAVVLMSAYGPVFVWSRVCRVSLHGCTLRLRGVAHLLAPVLSGLAPAVQRSPSADREDTEQFCTGRLFQGEHAAPT